MADQDRKPNHLANSPAVLGPILLAIVMVFATVLWLGARREMAALYGMIRAVEFPWVSRLAPYAEHFELAALRKGVVPGFSMIYHNSLVYGLFFTALTLGLMTLALLRLDKFSILTHVIIRSGKGRSPSEIMARLARSEPSVRFFLDYDVSDLPTTEGTARQPMRAIELLLYANAVTHVIVSEDRRSPPDLDLDVGRLRRWMVDRFGPPNPFGAIPKRRLLDVDEIERAVDRLSWPAVLLLYPALQRIHAFHVEGAEGYKTVQTRIDGFIDGIWEELNGLKREFGDAIALGFASAADREERNALYRAGRAKPAKTSRFRRSAKATPGEAPDIPPSTVLDNLTDLARVFRRGRIDRGEIEPDGSTERSYAGPKPRKAPQKPENLLFFGEVLSERGPHLAAVAAARTGLKSLLTRHLGVQRREYPVGTDPVTGVVVYKASLTTAEQKAFNTRAQERLARAQQAIERVLFNHQFEFSAIGGALELARNYGILPPNLFRWMRFCDETTPLWWFVQNLGMPAAYPENAAHYEHYQAERAMGVAVEQPHIHACIDGLRQEANRYLVPERVAELMTVLGKDAIVSKIVDEDAVSNLMSSFHDTMAKAAAEPAPAPTRPHQPAAPTPLAREGRGDGTAPAPQRGVVTRAGILDEFDLDED